MLELADTLSRANHAIPLSCSTLRPEKVDRNIIRYGSYIKKQLKKYSLFLKIEVDTCLHFIDFRRL